MGRDMKNFEICKRTKKHTRKWTMSLARKRLYNQPKPSYAPRPSGKAAKRPEPVQESDQSSDDDTEPGSPVSASYNLSHGYRGRTRNGLSYEVVYVLGNMVKVIIYPEMEVSGLKSEVQK